MRFIVPLGKIDVDSSTVLTQSYHLMAEFVQKMFLGGISFSIYTHKVKILMSFQVQVSVINIQP